MSDDQDSISIAAAVGRLRSLEAEHVRLAHEIWGANVSEAFEVDLVVNAVIQRSLALIDGFTALIERRNLLCATPLLRLQLDSIMRLYACAIALDTHSVVSQLLDGKPLHTLKSKDGQRLTDKHLHEQASGVFPWLSHLYEQSSSFVHLSSPHLFAPITGVDNGSRSAAIHIRKGGPKCEDSDVLGTVEAFHLATAGVLCLCHTWLTDKREIGGTAAPGAD